MFTITYLCVTKAKNMTTTTNTQKIEQNNTYQVYDSMGRKMEIYITASNIKDACKIAKQMKDVPYYHKVKRSYNGGVRGSNL